jgi:hypothetical protein
MSHFHSSLIFRGKAGANPDKSFEPIAIEQSGLLGLFISYGENEELWICTSNNENSCLITKITFHIETSGGQNSDLCLNVVHFFNISVN